MRTHTKLCSRIETSDCVCHHMRAGVAHGFEGTKFWGFYEFGQFFFHSGKILALFRCGENSRMCSGSAIQANVRGMGQVFERTMNYFSLEQHQILLITHVIEGIFFPAALVHEENESARLGATFERIIPLLCIAQLRW